MTNKMTFRSEIEKRQTSKLISVHVCLRHRQTDRQADRQRERQTDRQTDGRTDGRTERQTDRQNPRLPIALSCVIGN